MVTFTVLALFVTLVHATPLGAVTSTGQVVDSPLNLSEAPLNPDFVRYQQELASGRSSGQTGGGHGLGLVPAPIDFSYLTGQQIPTTLRSYPSSYDLRTLGKVSSVKDQGQCGSCWTFATYGSLESYLLTRESWNFSENNLKNLHGFDLDACNGGDVFMSTAYLARWSGPVNAADDPYVPYSSSSPPNLLVQKHVQDVYFIPARRGPLDNDNIKWAVTNYGGVYTGMWMDQLKAYDQNNYTYYYGSNQYLDWQNNQAGGHAVTIVGWNDNFDKNLFGGSSWGVPPGDGAFIVKNSWGTDLFGEKGYFYVSYYDGLFGSSFKTPSAVFTAEPASNYDHVYQHDPLGHIFNFGFGNDTAWFANVFTATSNEQLSAVSFYTWAFHSQYEIYVYKDSALGPNSDRYIGPTGTIPVTGYHTIRLSTKVPLTAGHTFTVVVKLRTPGYNFPISIERFMRNKTSDATASAGQGFVSPDGTTWKDITSYSPFGQTKDLCLKAFTTRETTVSSPTTKLKVSTTPSTAGVNTPFTLSGTLLPEARQSVVRLYHFCL